MKPLRLLITSALLLGSLAAAPVRFDIPAQPAPDALVAFGRQAKVEVLFRADELKGVSANEVKGEFEPDQALRQLLAGSGFSARQTAPTNFVVARLTGSSSGPSRAISRIAGSSRKVTLRSLTSRYARQRPV